MENSQLLVIIKTFNKKEFKDFGLFLTSPIFNREKVFINFFNYLKKKFPDLNENDVTKEKIYSVLYPAKKYNDSMMRKLISEFTRLAEDYISLMIYSQNHFEKNNNLLKYFRKRGLIKHFAKRKEKNEQTLDNMIYKNETYFINKYIAEDETRRLNQSLKNKAHYFKNNFEVISESLTIASVINILKINMHTINYEKNYFGGKLSLSLFDEIDNYLSKNKEKYENIIYIKFYYNCFKLLQTEEEKYYFELKDILEKDLNKLLPKNKSGLFSVMGNYCYLRVMHGDLNYIKEQFFIYKTNIESEFYKQQQNFLPHILYLNTMILGLESGESKWVENFVERKIDELNLEVRENLKNFSYSLINLHKKNYDKALEYSVIIQTNDVGLKHQIKSLMLKIYFEKNDADGFYSHIDSYRHFISNDKLISEDNKKMFSNYINYSKKLFDIKNLNKDFESEYQQKKLKEEILKNKFMINKSWLLNRINEIVQIKAKTTFKHETYDA